MHIGLISDTHIVQGRPGLDEFFHKVREIFKNVDLILHAGDILYPFVLDELERIAPVLAARGDDDLPLPDSRIKDRHELHFEGYSLWLCHLFPFRVSSHSLYALLCPSRDLLKRLDNELDSSLAELLKEHDHIPQIIVFGDTHRVLVHRHSRLLLVNPGSPTLPDHRTMPGTLVILSLSPGQAEVEVIQL